MIVGIGTDIVEIKHFKAVLKKTPSVIERLFTQNEQERANQLASPKKIPYYAKRFAAKEALSKACGCGIGKDLNWQDIEILNNEKGAPTIVLTGKIKAYLKKKFKCQNVYAFLSLTDEKDYAMAFVVLTK